MKALTTAVYGKASGSNFLTAINGRLCKGEAPAGTVYPYAVYMVVTGSPDNAFAMHYEDVTLQFSLYSSLSSSSEIEDIFTYLKALYDDCTLSPTGETVIFMQRTSQDGAMKEDHVTPSGSQSVWVIHVDYQIYVKV